MFRCLPSSPKLNCESQTPSTGYQPKVLPLVRRWLSQATRKLVLRRARSSCQARYRGQLTLLRQHWRRMWYTVQAHRNFQYVQVTPKWNVLAWRYNFMTASENVTVTTVDPKTAAETNQQGLQRSYLVPIDLYLLREVILHQQPTVHLVEKLSDAIPMRSIPHQERARVRIRDRDWHQHLVL